MQMERRRLKERCNGKLRRALRDKRASHMRRRRKEASTSYVPPPTRRRVRVSGALLTEVRDGKIVRL
jgi:hypothetical protein